MVCGTQNPVFVFLKYTAVHRDLTKIAFFLNMPKTAHCQVEPIKSQLLIDKGTLSLEEGVELEDHLQRWGKDQVFWQHVYAGGGVRYRILARMLPNSARMMAALHDKHKDMIILIAVKEGPHHAAINSIYAYSGLVESQFTKSIGWIP